MTRSPDAKAGSSKRVLFEASSRRSLDRRTDDLWDSDDPPDSERAPPSSFSRRRPSQRRGAGAGAPATAWAPPEPEELLAMDRRARLLRERLGGLRGTVPQPAQLQASPASAPHSPLSRVSFGAALDFEPPLEAAPRAPRSSLEVRAYPATPPSDPLLDAVLPRSSARPRTAPALSPDGCAMERAGPLAEGLRAVGGGFDAPSELYGELERAWLRRHRGYHDCAPAPPAPLRPPDASSAFSRGGTGRAAAGLRHGPAPRGRGGRGGDGCARRRRVEELEDRAAKAAACLEAARALPESDRLGRPLPFADAAPPEARPPLQSHAPALTRGAQLVAAVDELLRRRRPARPAPDEWRRLLPAWERFEAARGDARLALTAGEVTAALGAACALWRAAGHDEEGTPEAAAARRGTRVHEAAFLYARRRARIADASDAAHAAWARARLLDPAEPLPEAEFQRVLPLAAADRRRLQLARPEAEESLDGDAPGAPAGGEAPEEAGHEAAEAAFEDGVVNVAFDRAEAIRPDEYASALELCAAHWRAAAAAAASAAAGPAAEARLATARRALEAAEAALPGVEAIAGRPGRGGAVDEKARLGALRPADDVVAEAAADLAAAPEPALLPPEGAAGGQLGPAAQRARRALARFVALWRAPWTRLRPEVLEAALRFAPAYWRRRLRVLQRAPEGAARRRRRRGRRRWRRRGGSRRRRGGWRRGGAPRGAPGGRPPPPRSQPRAGAPRPRPAPGSEIVADSAGRQEFGAVVARNVHREERELPEAQRPARDPSATSGAGSSGRASRRRRGPSSGPAPSSRTPPAPSGPRPRPPLAFLAAHCRRCAQEALHNPGPLGAARPAELREFYEERAERAASLARGLERRAAEEARVGGPPPLSGPPEEDAELAEAEALAAAQIALFPRPRLAF
eukprot:tig00000144_g9117.t1